MWATNVQGWHICTLRKLFPTLYLGGKAPVSAVGFSVTGQGPKCRCASGWNTPGPNRSQIPSGEDSDAEGLCAGPLPLTIRLQSHRLPGHHVQTLAVSVACLWLAAAPTMCALFTKTPSHLEFVLGMSQAPLNRGWYPEQGMVP